jgi:hypothetical protein
MIPGWCNRALLETWLAVEHIEAIGEKYAPFLNFLKENKKDAVGIVSMLFTLVRDSSQRILTAHRHHLHANIWFCCTWTCLPCKFRPVCPVLLCSEDSMDCGRSCGLSANSVGSTEAPKSTSTVCVRFPNLWYDSCCKSRYGQLQDLLRAERFEMETQPISEKQMCQ